MHTEGYDSQLTPHPDDMKAPRFPQIVPVIILFLLSFLLLFFKLSTLMPFIGDQAWFYLSARDVWEIGAVPLVGITSSHTWLHQGPLWTYLLAALLPLGKFNPILPAFFTVLVTQVTFVWFYIVAGEFFSRKAAFVATAFFATSPLVIMAARMPYHTTLIPTFCLMLLFVTFLWVRGNAKVFPLLFFFLAVLYNLELATVVLWLVPLLLLIYGFWLKAAWFSSVMNKKSLLLSFVFGVVPMIPILLYDSSHGFPQTIVYGGWIVARVLHPLLPLLPLAPSGHSFSEMFSFLVKNNAGLVLGGQELFAVIITLVGIIWFVASVLKSKNLLQIIVGLYFFIPLLGLLLSKTPSGAYIPMLFPTFFLLLGIGFANLARNVQQSIVLAVVVVGIVLLNSVWLVTNNYLIKTPQGNGVGIAERVAAAKAIVEAADGKKYSLIQEGPGSEFESSRMNTEYLTWWLGNPPQEKRQQIVFTVKETPEKIILRRGNSILGIW